MSRDDHTDSFIQEVDAGLREDRYMSMLRRWGPYAGVALVVLFFSVWGADQWRQSQVRAAETQAAAFAAAQQQAQSDLHAATARFEQLSHQGPEVYRVLAMMEHAATLQAQGDIQNAIAGFDAAATAANDPLLRDTARLRAAYLVADSQDLQAVQRRVQPLIQGGGQISYLAKELLAVKAWQAGQLDLARTTLRDLSLTLDVPESMRQRAGLALQVIGEAPTPAPAPQPHQGETK